MSIGGWRSDIAPPAMAAVSRSFSSAVRLVSQCCNRTVSDRAYYCSATDTEGR